MDSKAKSFGYDTAELRTNTVSHVKSFLKAMTLLLANSNMQCLCTSDIGVRPLSIVFAIRTYRH